MATRRFKSATMKFGVPLSVPGSRYVERCYGFHGAARVRSGPIGVAIDLVLINAQRQLWTARYSPCGKFLIAAGYDALIHRWDVTEAEPKLLESLAGHQGWTQRIAFAGESLLTAVCRASGEMLCRL